MENFMENTKSLADLKKDFDSTYATLCDIALNISQMECCDDECDIEDDAVIVYKHYFEDNFEILSDLYHRYLGLVLFKLNDKCENEFTYNFEKGSPIESGKRVVSISTLSNEGMIWFNYEDGLSFDDTDISIPNMKKAVDYFSELI